MRENLPKCGQEGGHVLGTQWAYDGQEGGHILGTWWAHSRHTVGTQWAHSGLTMGTQWAYGEHMLVQFDSDPVQNILSQIDGQKTNSSF